MTSLDIFCFNHFNLKNKIMKIEHKKIFRGPSKIWKNISWPINICLKYFMASTKTLRPPSYILNVRSLKDLARRTASDKILHGKAYDIPKNPKYDGYQCGLATMVYKFFVKKNFRWNS